MIGFRRTAWGVRRFVASSALACAVLASYASFAHAGDLAHDSMRKGDYAAAVEPLRQTVARTPQSAAAQRDLGISLFKSGDSKGALPPLQTASTLNARDRATFYFLGAAAEASGDSALALNAYRSCLALGGKNLAPVRARIAALTRAEIVRNVAHALKIEHDLKLADIPVNTVAVPEFALAGAADSLRPLCRGLAVVMLTDLRRVPQLRVVERERLQVLLHELASTGGDAAAAKAGAPGPAFDPATAPRYGRLIGVRQFAQGALLPLHGDVLELNASVIDVESGAVRGAGAPVDGSLNTVLDLEKRLLYQILDTLGVRVDTQLRRAIGGPPTRNLNAFLAFSRGVELEDQGLSDAAASAYQSALKLDPGFSLARERMESVQSTAAATGRMEQQIMSVVTAPPASTGDLPHSTEALGFGPVGTVAPAPAPLTSTSHLGTRPITVKISWH